MPRPDPVTSLEVYITAAEAYPAFEDMFLAARSEIWASFRVFDLSTGLRSPRARAVGRDWFDLFFHTLRRGVDITLTLADFDPIVATRMHRESWAAARKLAGVADLASDAPGKLTFRVARHPARVGALPRMAFAGKVKEKLGERDPDELTPGLQDLSSIPDLSPATHHQKIAVFDREILFIGGLDLNERRFDTPRHDQASAQTWHDVHLRVTGPVVAAAQRHVETFEAVTEGRVRPQPPAEGFVRTLSARRAVEVLHIAPRTLCSEIFAAHVAAIRGADRLIYLETQFFRDRALASALARRGAEVPDLKVILVLPAAPEDVAFEGNDGPDARFGEHLQVDCIDTLRKAFADRLLVCSPVRAARAHAAPAARLHGAPIVYVHSKVSVFDTGAAIVSSANLNGRSMNWDTEAGILLRRPEHVEQVRGKVMGHWMPEPLDEAPAARFDRWSRAVRANFITPPDGVSHYLLPYDLKRAERVAEDIVGLPDSMV